MWSCQDSCGGLVPTKFVTAELVGTAAPLRGRFALQGPTALRCWDRWADWHSYQLAWRYWSRSAYWPWNPLALDLLEKAHLDTSRLRSKSWDEFAKRGAPVMHFVFTVCDQAAGEVCPVWPGNPVTAHWGVADPAAVEGPQAEKIRAFRYAYQALETRIKLFTSLRLEALDRLAIQRRVDEIGRLRAIPK